jgi:hypothetical protein
MSLEDTLQLVLQNINKIVAGVEVDWNTIAEDKKSLVVTAAVHCCVNGPVGVNKLTNIPGIQGQLRINSLGPFSNRSWKTFCRQVANFLIISKLVIDCGAMRRLKTFWPLKEWV